jgi:aldehyde dehydrogenase (NAD+)
MSKKMKVTEENAIQSVVHKLRVTYSTGLTRDYSWRINQIKRLKAMLMENESLISEALYKDLGRCKFEALGLEVCPQYMDIELALNELHNWMKPNYTPVPALIEPATSEYIYEPYGVCLILGAFNYPFFLLTGPFLGAIVAGNCAVIKPSELSVHSEKLISELIPKYLDQNAFKVITGGVSTSEILLKQQWDKIFFTGSPRVGKLVMKAAADFLTPVSLELGGKSPTIIDESVVDLDLVTHRILWGKFANAGQTCIAPDYILCHSKHYDKFVEKVGTTIEKFYGKDIKLSKDFGRIITENHCKRLKDLIEDCKHNNFNIIFGGSVDIANRYVEPTVIANITKSDSKIMTDEIFGPLLPIIRVDDINEAINYIQSNGRENPLALYIFAKNKKTIEKIITSVPSGGVLVNDTLYHCGTSFIPFGGKGNSGMGSYHGKFSFECFSHRRAILRRDDHYLFDVSIRYPPYTDFGFRIFKLVAGWPSVPHVTTRTNFIVCLSAIYLVYHYQPIGELISELIAIFRAFIPKLLYIPKF